MDCSLILNLTREEINKIKKSKKGVTINFYKTSIQKRSHTLMNYVARY
jgi:hypothetical protein